MRCSLQGGNHRKPQSLHGRESRPQLISEKGCVIPVLCPATACTTIVVMDDWDVQLNVRPQTRHLTDLVCAQHNTRTVHEARKTRVVRSMMFTVLRRATNKDTRTAETPLKH